MILIIKLIKIIIVEGIWSGREDNCETSPRICVPTLKMKNKKKIVKELKAKDDQLTRIENNWSHRSTDWRFAYIIVFGKVGD